MEQVNELSNTRLSTGKLYIYSSAGLKLGTGSGFHIGKGYFLTAGHCFQTQSGYLNLQHSFVVFENIPGNIRIDIESCFYHQLDGQSDFAIFKLKKIPIYKAQLSYSDPYYRDSLEIDRPKPSNDPKTALEKKVHVMGYKHGTEFTIVEGQIQMTDHAPLLVEQTSSDSENFFRYSAETWGGVSGGPIFSVAENAVVGIHDAGYERDRALGVKNNNVSQFGPAPYEPDDGADQLYHKGMSIKSVNKILNQKKGKTLQSLISESVNKFSLSQDIRGRDSEIKERSGSDSGIVRLEDQPRQHRSGGCFS